MAPQMRLSGGELRNIYWLLSEHVARIVSGFLIGVIVARYLGPDNFGFYSYVTSIVAICAPLTRLGMDVVVIRALAEDPDNRNRYLNAAFGMRIAASLAVFLLSTITIILIPGEARIKAYAILMVSSLLFGAGEVVDYYYQAEIKSKFATICRLIGLSISGAMKIYCMYSGKPLEYFFWIFFVDTIILNALYVAMFRFKERQFIYPVFDREFARRIMRMSWPLLISSVATTIYMRVDQIIILHFLDHRQVGLYAAATRIVETFYVLPTLVGNTLFPGLVVSRKGSEITFEHQMIRLYRINVGISVVFALAMTVAAPYVVDVIFGAEFAPSANVLLIEVWGAVFMSLLISSGKYLVATGDTAAVLQRNVGAALINITLNLILIPRFGIIGAAISSLIATVFASVFYDMLSRSHWPMLRMKFMALGFKFS